MMSLMATAREGLRQRILSTVFKVADGTDLDQGQVASVFNALDKNRDGTISKAEFSEAAASLGFEPSGGDLQMVMNMFDTDGDGTIVYSEFIGFLKGADAKKKDEDTLKPFRICLTGGPCGGKSTAILSIKERLKSSGLHVATVDEGATLAFNGWGGFDPTWIGTPAHAEMQAALISYQLDAEQLFER